ncbi:hypothetical protein L0F63_004566 [Massospora cicadina]|nr:hypothetical protein L0F63_004566 [Massospora cicadina]
MDGGMGKYVLDRNLVDGILTVENGVLLLVAGLLSVGCGIIVLHFNRRHRRFLIAASAGQFMGTVVLQVGLQAILLSGMKIDMALRIVCILCFLMGGGGALLAWFFKWEWVGSIIVGLAAYDIISIVVGLILAVIVSFMTFTYRTPLEIVDAGFIGSSLLFHGLYAMGMGIVSLASLTYPSYAIFEAYRFYGGLITLALTLLAFALNAGYHYRTYRIQKETLFPYKFNI